MYLILIFVQMFKGDSMFSVLGYLYKKYNEFTYIKYAAPFVYIFLYMFYYYTILSPVYSLNVHTVEVVNPMVFMPCVTGMLMIFVSFMYDDSFIRRIFGFMYIFSMGYSVYITIIRYGDIYSLDYIIHIVILLINCVGVPYLKSKI